MYRLAVTANVATAGTDSERRRQPVGDEVRAKVVGEAVGVAKAPSQPRHVPPCLIYHDRNPSPVEHASGDQSREAGSNHGHRRPVCAHRPERWKVATSRPPLL